MRTLQRSVTLGLAIAVLLLLPCAASAGLVGHWSFDDNTNIGADSAGSNHGTLVGDAAQGPGFPGLGSALVLDGDGDYVNVGGNATFEAIDDDDDGWTVAAWVNTTGNDQVQRIFSTLMPAEFLAAGWGAGLRTDLGAPQYISTTYGRVDMHHPADGTLDGEWHQLAYVFKNNQGSIATEYFLDGKSVGSQTTQTPFGIADSTGDYGIGALQLPSSLQFFNGSIDDVRVYDHELSASDVLQLYTDVVPDILRLDIDRETGNITLANETAATLEIAGYKMTSGIGALDQTAWLSITDNYDTDSGDMSVDADDEWLKFSESSFDLSEGSIGTAAFAASQSIDLGNAWRGGPAQAEDISLELLLEDGTVLDAIVAYSGNDGARFEFGDLDMSGSIDSPDWLAYRTGFGQDLSGLTPAEAYFAGDLNGDGVNDRGDFRMFKNIYDGAVGAGALAALIADPVPEPSPVVLLALAGCVGLVASSRGRGSAIAVAACLVMVLWSGTACANVVSFEAEVFDDVADVSTNGTLVTAVNLGHGDESGGVNIGAPTVPVVVNGVTFSSDPGDGTGLFVVDVGGAVAPGTFKGNDGNDFYGGDLYDSAANPIAGLSAADADALLDSVEFGGGIGNSIARLTGLSIGQDYEFQIMIARNNSAGGMSFGYSTPSGDANEVYQLTGVPMSPPSIVTGTFFADETVQDLHLAIAADQNLEASAFQLREIVLLLPTLEVNVETGQVRIVNSTDEPFEFDYYEITSPEGALRPDRWASLQDNDFEGNGPPSDAGDGWEELGTPNTHLLAEGFALDSSFLQPGESVSLGTAFDTSVFGEGNEGDLAVAFEDPSGTLLNVRVQYVAGLSGDYNGDGVVDAADYTAWRDALSAPAGTLPNDPHTGVAIGTAQYDTWRANFGATSVGDGTAADAAAVPEPTVLCLLGTLVLRQGRMRMRRQGPLAA